MGNYRRVDNLMNDFTKEELEKICQFFNIAIEDFNEPDNTYELRDKIQSMIDNYCDHDFRTGQHLFTDTYCTKCNLVKDEKCEHKWIECYYGEESIPINLCALCNLRERR